MPEKEDFSRRFGMIFLFFYSGSFGDKRKVGGSLLWVLGRSVSFYYYYYYYSCYISGIGA